MTQIEGLKQEPKKKEFWKDLWRASWRKLTTTADHQIMLYFIGFSQELKQLRKE